LINTDSYWMSFTHCNIGKIVGKLSYSVTIRLFELCYCFQELYFVELCALSAGVGRTGVFITLSILLERMRFEGVVDTFQTVNVLRTQRPAMVQTEVNEMNFNFKK